MKYNRSTLSFVATAVIGGFAACSSAQLLAYEGFDYKPSPELGMARGGFGWIGGWNDVGALPTGVMTRGLTWPNLVTTGNAAFTAADNLPLETGYARTMLPFVSRDPLYVSFLFQQFSSSGSTGGLFLGDVRDGVTVGINPGNGMYGIIPLGARLGEDTRLPARIGATALLVTRITDNGDGTITYGLFVNPEVSTIRPDRLIPNTTYTMRGEMPMALEMVNDGGFITDEIRVGSSWSSVLPPIVAPVCTADFDDNGTVDGADLATLLGNWGTPAADLNADRTTDASDLSILLGAWGACQ